jgi:hypothetical protein
MTKTISGIQVLRVCGGEIVRKKGEELHTVSTNENMVFDSSSGRSLYTSFLRKDVAAYRGPQSSELELIHKTNKCFDYTLSASKDLISPNKTKRIKEFIELHREDKNIVYEMGKTKVKTSVFLGLMKSFGYDRSSKEAENYRKMIDSDDPKDKEKAFKDFAGILSLSDYSRQKYFSRLAKEGFNSIYDDNDIYNKTAEKPLIVFDPATSLKIGSKLQITDKVRSDATVEWWNLKTGSHYK